MPALSNMGALKISNPEGWKDAVVSAMTNADGRVADAAVMLKVSARQLFRWLAEDNMKSIPRAAFGLPRDGKRGRRAKKEVKVIPSCRRVRPVAQ